MSLVSKVRKERKLNAVWYWRRKKRVWNVESVELKSDHHQDRLMAALVHWRGYTEGLGQTHGIIARALGYWLHYEKTKAMMALRFFRSSSAAFHSRVVADYESALAVLKRRCFLRWRRFVALDVHQCNVLHDGALRWALREAMSRLLKWNLWARKRRVDVGRRERILIGASHEVMKKALLRWRDHSLDAERRLKVENAALKWMKSKPLVGNRPELIKITSKSTERLDEIREAVRGGHVCNTLELPNQGFKSRDTPSFSAASVSPSSDEVASILALY